MIVICSNIPGNLGSKIEQECLPDPCCWACMRVGANWDHISSHSGSMWGLFQSVPEEVGPLPCTATIRVQVVQEVWNHRSQAAAHKISNQEMRRHCKGLELHTTSCIGAPYQQHDRC